MNIARALVVPALLLSVGGCSLPVTVDIDCAWASEIRFAAPTKAWLHGLYDKSGKAKPGTPSSLQADLEKVRKHNFKHAEFCR